MPRILLATLLAAVLLHPAAAQTLETETANLLPRGALEAGLGYEQQFSGEGTEIATPFVINYGVTDNLEVVVEPVPYTSIRPKLGASAVGRGDFEVTLQYRGYHNERTGLSLAVGAEAKLPTARNTQIGTGAADYTAYLIASRRLGRANVHANLGYTFVGQPAGLTFNLNNTVNAALAIEATPFAKTEVFAEVLGVTAAIPSGIGGSEGPAGIPELSGGELFGTVGVGRYVTPGVLAYFSLTLDSTGALLVHPGLTLRLH